MQLNKVYSVKTIDRVATELGETVDRIFDREHEAGREHAHLAAGVHQGRRVRDEDAGRHQLVEAARPAVADARLDLELGGGHRRGDAPEQILGLLADLAADLVLGQITVGEDGGRVFRQLRLGQVGRDRGDLEQGRLAIAGRAG